MSFPPAGYEPVERIVEIHTTLTDRQYRRLHELLGTQPGRHKYRAEHYVFDLPIDEPAGQRMLAYLREQQLEHSVVEETRWRRSRDT